MATLIYSRFLLHPTSLFRMATAAAESAVVAVNPSGISHRKISTFTRVSLPANTPPSLDLQCRSLRSAFPSVIKAQVATIEQAATEAPQKVESPVVINIGASRGIGKAVNLALGKAAASRCFSSSAASSIEKKDLLSLSEVEKILHDVRADDIKVIPSPKGCEFADYIVIATGRSPWHVRNISQALIYKVKQKQLGAKRMVLPSVVGQEGGKWIVIDSGKLIVHAVDEKARAYYNFEGLWSTRKSNVDDSQMQDLEMAFVKVRPKNNSKRAST